MGLVTTILDWLSGGPFGREDDRLGELRQRQQVIEAKALMRGWITQDELREAIEGPKTDESERDPG